ncbi:uncharacterized protein HKW66_Vig0140810 [Vigna angularis]|uniref:Uncharacterized protein n=3 Tax=Phaseolus angularis TaxID=3914 RepID=A0A8T0KGZ9_PHAAN|nr:uncharacterized protein HKW66_Vig0140810 [Vigna angularis]
MEDLDSLLIYPEGEQELRQKLMDARLELETTKHLKTELFNRLKMAYQERDEARCQLAKLRNQFMPSSSNNLQNMFDMQNNFTFPSAIRASSGITESDNSLSHGSPQVEFLFDSSTEVTNIHAVNPFDKMSYLNQNPIQDFNFSAPHVSMIPYIKPVCDPAAAVIDRLANERGLPQMGQLLQAVKDAGPLLNTLLLAGQLPTWVNPPPIEKIKVPPIAIKKCDVTSIIKPNTFGESGNSLLKPRIPTLHHSSNALSTCSASMLNLAGQTTGSWNSTWQLNSTSGVTSKSRQ